MEGGFVGLGKQDSPPDPTQVPAVSHEPRDLASDTQGQRKLRADTRCCNWILQAQH